MVGQKSPSPLTSFFNNCYGRVIKLRMFLDYYFGKIPILPLGQVIKKCWHCHKCWHHHKCWHQKVLTSSWMQNYSTDFKLSHENTFHHSMDISQAKRVHLSNILNCAFLKYRQFFLTPPLTQVPYIQTLWSNCFHNFFTEKY